MTYCEKSNVVVVDERERQSMSSGEFTPINMEPNDDERVIIRNNNNNQNSDGSGNVGGGSGVNRRFMNSTGVQTLGQNLRLKLLLWFAFLFGKNERKHKHHGFDVGEQEIELIKGDDEISQSQSLDSNKDSTSETDPEGGHGGSGGGDDSKGYPHGNGHEKHTQGQPAHAHGEQLPKEYINFGEEDQMEIEGYEKSSSKTFITWTFIVLSAGLLRLVFHWWPQLMVYATHRRTTIAKAEKILVIEHYNLKYKRYHVKTVATLTTDLFKTATLFPTAGKDQPENHEGNAAWAERLKEELRGLESPKLAIPQANGTVQETNSIRVFSCKKLRYIWNDQLQLYEKLHGINSATTFELHKYHGLSLFEQCQRRLIYGNNEIKVEVQSIIKLLFLEVLNPFYVFQIFSVSLWVSDNYYYFSVAIVIMSVWGIVTTIRQTRSNQRNLRKKVVNKELTTVCRGRGLYEEVPSEHIVPGDVIVIPSHGCQMLCDAVLLDGNCIVNESMLTGESVPVTKTPLPNRLDIIYNSKEHARHTLFSGTEVMQTRIYGTEKVHAVVLRSGFLTAKGNLVRSIMYPPPVDYKFERDSYKFVAVLALLAGIGFINSIFTKVAQGKSLRDIIVDSLDLITIVVPPALPAAMTVGRYYAQSRLEKQRGIYCISPRAINVSGSIDCVCFDKTGTLTEGGLDFWGAVPTKAKSTANGNDRDRDGGDRHKNANDATRLENGFEMPVHDVAHLSTGELLIGMACCHTLTRIDGKLVGEPLELKVFEWTGWALEEPRADDTSKFDFLVPTIVRPKPKETEGGNSGHDGAAIAIEADDDLEIGIVRQFPFSSTLQRSSVITKRLGAQDFELYCKGSPEMIKSLARPGSVPPNFEAALQTYTQQGYRVIALAHKVLRNLEYAKMQRVVREEVEADLTFLGLIVLENRLKPETTGVMKILKKAAIRTIMVTGDNMLTAISVAGECGMLAESEKVIVVDAEIQSKAKIPKLLYYYANKVSTVLSDGATSEDNSSFTPNGSVLDKKLIINNNNILNQIEAPSARYHFAITGTVFHIIKTYYPELMPRILVRGTVFARMSPEQKQQLVELLQGLGYFVGMCGDGSNDVGALKAAHAGISLSDTESSVAAPFTSKEPNITCVPHLIREGRAALVTSFGIFKYMATYSLTQFVTVIILYTISSNLSDKQFLYIDLALISVFAFFFGRVEPHPGPLVKQTPSASLVSVPPIASILLHMASIVGTQTFAFIYVHHQPWFTPFVPDEHNDEKVGCYENFTLFAVSSFQYIIMAMMYQQGPPYRKPFWTNPGLISAFIIMTSITLWIVVWPVNPMIDFLELVVPPNIYYRLSLVGFALCNLVAAIIIEYGIVNYILAKKVVNFSFLRGNCISSKAPKDTKRLYTQINYELSRRIDWPPVMSYSPSHSLSSTPLASIAHLNETPERHDKFYGKSNKLPNPNDSYNNFTNSSLSLNEIEGPMNTYNNNLNNSAPGSGHKRSSSIPPIYSPPLPASPNLNYHSLSRGHLPHRQRHQLDEGLIILPATLENGSNYQMNSPKP